MANILEDNIDYLERLLLALKDIKFGEESIKAAEHYKVPLGVVDSYVRTPWKNLQLKVVATPQQEEKLNPGMPIANTSLETKVKNILLENGFNTVRQFFDNYSKIINLFEDDVTKLYVENWAHVHRSDYDFTMGVAVNQPEEEMLNASMPVANTDLDIRVRNILANNNIFTVRQLYSMNGLDLRRMFSDDANELFQLNQWMRTNNGKFKF